MHGRRGLRPACHSLSSFFAVGWTVVLVSAAPAPAARAEPATQPRSDAPAATRPVGAAAAKAGAAPARAAPAAGAPRSLNELAGEGPVDFRCDKMDAFTKPNRTVCIGNVVFRRAGALVCCRLFEGLANDKWELQKATCIDDVRAQRGDEMMWADRAEYIPARGDLVLTGRPIVRRGDSIIEGERVVANTNEDRARVDKPRGRLVSEDSRAAPPSPGPLPAPVSPLPTTCPLPKAPR